MGLKADVPPAQNGRHVENSVSMLNFKGVSLLFFDSWDGTLNNQPPKIKHLNFGWLKNNPFK